MGSGYTRVLLIGTTGAGKTTLARQLLGTDPDRERFPSTSAAKTTVFDTEIVTADGDYEAVVSFMSEREVAAYVEDCLVQAGLAAASGENISAKLLEHTEQRFRLSYILGTPAKALQSEFIVEEEEGDEELEVDAIQAEFKAQLAARLQAYIRRIREVALAVRSVIERQLNLKWDSASTEDAAALAEAFEDEFRPREEFIRLREEIVTEIRQRFESVRDGSFDSEASGWPAFWYLKTGDRKHFLNSVNTFTSNYAARFGRLLTPIVNGLRVRGPFKPAWTERAVKFVIFDREGLGHTPDSAVSVPTHITETYDSVDAIVLVDSAASPMQAAPSAALRSLVTGGYEHKLFIAFTHFDDVRGDNFAPRDISAREQHVRSSVDNVVSSIGDALGGAAHHALQRALDGRVFFLSDLHKRLTNPRHYTLSQLNRFLTALEKAAATEAAFGVRPHPIYSDGNLDGLIAGATGELHELWDIKLGIIRKEGLIREHWTRVKALCKRLGFPIGNVYQYEYDSLRPVADFIRVISEKLTVFTAQPMRWEPRNSSVDSQRDVVAEVSRTIFKDLHDLGKQRLAWTKADDWARAYGFHGTGSTKIRAGEIKGIFREGAPAELRASHAEVEAFSKELRRIIVAAIQGVGGKLVASSSQF
jgi:adenylate kinase family enzyme